MRLLAAALAMAALWACQAQSTQRVIAADTVLSADLVVDSNETLVIKPGVALRFEGYRAFTVYGVLIAEGTATRPILITAVDRPTGSREAPAWQGLSVQGKVAHARLRYCRIEGAFANTIWGTSSVIDSCEFAGNARGLYVGRGSTAVVRGCRIYRNLSGLIVSASAPTVLQNTITENDAGLSLEAGSAALTGRNIIRGNGVDTRVDQVLGSSAGTYSSQRLWETVRELY